MKYIINSKLNDFQAWSGAKSTLETLRNFDDIEAIEEEIQEYYEEAGEIPTETDINYFLWFETDMIAEYLGYENWETYCKLRKEDRV